MTDSTDEAPLPKSETPISFFFRLSGSGRELWSGWDFELCGPHAQDFELADGHAYGEDLAQSQYLSMVTSQPSELVGVSESTKGVTELLQTMRVGKVQLGFSHAMFPIKFGMQANQNFYTGGIALQTISNPTLEITAYANGAPVTTAFWDTYDAEVTLRYSQMLRIDSDTGVITTTLTS